MREGASRTHQRTLGDGAAVDDRCDLLCLDLPLAEQLRARRPDDAAARSLAERFQALADPTRLTIAMALRDASELCVCDLAWVVERAQNLVSHHLRSLRSAGLVDYRRDGKMALYSLTAQGRSLLELVSLEEPPARG
jgi:DNA-binding transcriptional ArsR family regulator